VVNFIDLLKLEKLLINGEIFSLYYFLKLKSSKVSLIENDLQKLYYDNMTVRYAKKTEYSEQYIENMGIPNPLLEPFILLGYILKLVV
jgi:hypothetical protein